MTCFLCEQGKCYDRCALVGSSSGLLLAQHGAAIDSHSLVLRLGPSLISGYEPYVGSQPGIRIFDDYFPENLTTIGQSIVTSAAAAAGGSNVERLKSLHHAAESISPLVLHPLFEGHVKSVFNCDETSVGFLAAVLAVNVCRSVTAYGLTPWAGW